MLTEKRAQLKIERAKPVKDKAKIIELILEITKIVLQLLLKYRNG